MVWEHFSLNEGGFIYDINYSNDTNLKLKEITIKLHKNIEMNDEDNITKEKFGI